MHIRLTIHESGGVAECAVLSIDGTLTAEARREVLLECVRGCLDDGRRAVILNLHGVPYCDTTGIATLLRCHRAVDRTNGLLFLVSVQPRVRQPLRQAGLLAILTTFEDEDAAIAEVRRRQASRPGAQLEKWST